MRRSNFGAPGAPFTKARALAWEEVRTDLALSAPFDDVKIRREIHDPV